MTLGDALRSDASLNLTPLRFLLAAAVILSHAWPLALGPAAPEPLEELTGRSLGGWAVGVFFFISGLLITASAETRTPLRFWAARVRRIFPGLVVALLVTCALAAASGSSAGFTENGLWFLRAITLVSIEHRLPGAFHANPYPEIVNGPLWSLFHEVAAYAVCAFFVWMGLARRKMALAVLLLVTLTLCLARDVLPGRIATFAPLFFAFACGMGCYIWRDRIVLRWRSGLACLAVAAALPWALAMGVAGFALVTLALCGPVVRLHQDASYGLYIYGWPVAQTVVALAPGLAPLPLAGWTLAITYPLALLSWQFVERPALRVRLVRA